MLNTAKLLKNHKGTTLNSITILDAWILLCENCMNEISNILKNSAIFEKVDDSNIGT